MRTIAFIDAGQFRMSILNQRLKMDTHQRFDWSKFKTLLNEISGGSIKDTHYFDACSETPTEARAAFHQFLRNGLEFNLHFTPLRERRRICNHCNKVIVEFEQKGVDVNITTSMLQLAYNSGYDQAILCTGDGDFANVAEVIRQTYGKRIIVLGWSTAIAGPLRDAANQVLFIENFRDKIVGTGTKVFDEDTSLIQASL